MIICAAGAIHGALDRLFEDVLTFEESLGVRFEWVLHVGDFGMWPRSISWAFSWLWHLARSGSSNPLNPKQE
jgi:hypothetical protein